MTMNRTDLQRLVAVLVTVALAPTAPVPAGGFLDGFAFVDQPSPYPGELLFDTIPIRHDARCIPVPYSLNDTLDPVPNPLGPDFLALADAEAALRRAFDAWNDVPTSYIDMRLVATSQEPLPLAFDTINEVSFRPFPIGGALAISPSISLTEDSLLADGVDLDGDGDPDVVAGIDGCVDVDGDGDFERPAGFYAAGTIVENDVWFNTAARWTVEDADADTNFSSFDLQAVATHELGHSHGLAHSLINQISADDPQTVTMYPFFDGSDPASELAQRTLAADDVGYSSLHYPEGTASSGPAALQPGDVPFSAVYATLSGEVIHGETGVPVVGASVSAVDRGSGETVAADHSGSARVSWHPATGVIRPLPGFDSLLHGRYTLPVPAGVHEVRIEAIDGRPVGLSSVSRGAAATAELGLLSFDEEAWDRDREAAIETDAGHATPLPVQPGDRVTAVDLVTNRTFAVANFGTLNAVVFTGAPPGTQYAVRVPIEQLLEATNGEPFAVHSADFFTFVANDSDLPFYARAALVTGRILPDGSAELVLDDPLAVASGFVAQELDFSPVTFRNAVGLGARIEQGIASGQIEHLFLVLQIPTETPYPGVSGFPPLVGADAAPPIEGLSYLSFSGDVFRPETRLDFLFRLTLSELP